jgi:site-specific DNA-methyltransferase (adenine-specific)
VSVRVEHLAEGVTLYCGDCRDVLPTLGRADAVVTDPPYGVGFTGKAGHYRNEPNAKRTDTYRSFADTPQNFDEVVLPALKSALAIADRGAVFMASRNIPRLPDGDLGGIYLPNGCGLSSWGFQNFMHVMFYGTDPYLAAGLGCRPNGRHGIYGNDANQVDHPCAKPLAAMKWAVARASFEGHSILDPFMGSGTTGVACVALGRQFVGIEIEPAYFETACKRITAALAQPDIFIERPAPAAYPHITTAVFDWLPKGSIHVQNPPSAPIP